MMMDRVFERLAQLGTGAVSDAMLRLGLHGWMDGVRAVNASGAVTVGRARTLLFGPKRGEGQWPKTMYRTISSLDSGEILVIGSGETKENLLGDNVATHASLVGLAAIVTDSTVRDGDGMQGLGMPVYARGRATRIPITMEPVALDVPIVCAGAQVRPGDVLVADDDGIVVIPASRFDDVLAEIEDIAPIEAAVQEAIAKRASLEDIEALLKKKKTPRV